MYHYFKLNNPGNKQHKHTKPIKHQLNALRYAILKVHSACFGNTQTMYLCVNPPYEPLHICRSAVRCVCSLLL